MATLQEAVAVEVMGGRTGRAHRSPVRAVGALAAAVAVALSVSLAGSNVAGAWVSALNPQPIPPGVHGDRVLALNPQPLPPGDAETLA